MPALIVLPTQEDKITFREGKVPENFLEFEFDTGGELERFVEGLEAGSDAEEFSYEHGPNIGLDVTFDGEKVPLHFLSDAQRDAYVKGLEAGHGYIDPQVFADGDEEYAELRSRLGLDAASPSP